MIDWTLSRNLDWSVDDKDTQRLVVTAILRRKPDYFVRNYVFIVFLLTTAIFTTFISRPFDLSTRVSIVFTILLTIVYFKYSAVNAAFPQTPYQDILGTYISTNFYIVLLIGIVSFAFSTQCTMGGFTGLTTPLNADTNCVYNPGHIYSLAIADYNPIAETIVGFVLLSIWLSFNFRYWSSIYQRFELNIRIVEAADLGWMSFPTNRAGPAGYFDSRRMILETRRLSWSFHDLCVGAWNRSHTEIEKHDSLGKKKLSPKNNDSNNQIVPTSSTLFEVAIAKRFNEDQAATIVQGICRRKAAIETKKKMFSKLSAGVSKS
jgi:hypothetical protein